MECSWYSPRGVNRVQVASGMRPLLRTRFFLFAVLGGFSAAATGMGPHRLQLLFVSRAVDVHLQPTTMLQVPDSTALGSLHPNIGFQKTLGKKNPSQLLL